MVDYSVEVTNRELDVYDSNTGTLLEEIRDLLKLILERLPPAQQQGTDHGS